MTTAPIDISQHTGLVHHFIRRHGCVQWLTTGAMDQSDLFQLGMMGLARAAETYDPSKGAWTTYAWQWLRQSIGRGIENGDGTIRLPVHEQRKRLAAGARKRPKLRRLDAPTRVASDEPGERTLGDMIASGDPAPDAQLEAEDQARVLERLMAEARLTTRERTVIRRRFSQREETLDAISRDLGCTRERTRQIEVKALSKLRGAAERLSQKIVPRRRVTAGDVL